MPCGKIDRCIQEIADGHIEALLSKPGLDLLPRWRIRKPAHRIGRFSGKMTKIVEGARGPGKFPLASANGHRAWQLTLQLALIIGVGCPSVIRVERKLM